MFVNPKLYGVIGIIFIALSLPIPSEALLLYSKPAFKGKVIDTETKQPIEGVVVVAEYEKRVYRFVESDSEVIHIREVLTDRNGIFYIPGYTTLIDPLSWMGTVRIILCKPGYGRYFIHKKTSLILDGSDEEKYFSEDNFGKNQVFNFFIQNKKGKSDYQSIQITSGIVELERLPADRGVRATELRHYKSLYTLQDEMQKAKKYSKTIADEEDFLNLPSPRNIRPLRTPTGFRASTRYPHFIPEPDPAVPIPRRPLLSPDGSAVNMKHSKSGGGIVGPPINKEEAPPTVKSTDPIDSLRVILSDTKHRYHYLDRAEAAYLLGVKSRDPHDAELLAHKLYEAPPIPEKARRGLEQMGSIAVDVLIRVLDNTLEIAPGTSRGTFGARMHAAKAIEVIKNPKVMEYLIKILAKENKDSVIAESAAIGLGNYPNARVATALAEIAHLERNLRSRPAAYRSLIKIGSPAVNVLIPLLKERNAGIRFEVIYCLMEIGDIRATPALIDILRDPIPEIRHAARYALSVLGDERAVQPQLKDWKSNDQETRHEAILGILMIGPPAVKQLVAMLGDRDPQLRIRAAWCLGWIGDPAAVEPLTKLRNDEVFEVRWLGVEAISQIGKGNAGKGISEFCSDQYKEIRDLANDLLMRLTNYGCNK